jgi:surface antigen
LAVGDLLSFPRIRNYLSAPPMTTFRLAAFAVLAAASVAVHAQSNMAFLKDAPIQKMTQEDIALMLKNSNEALSKNANGETSGWANAKTGASGTATPLRSFTQKGMKCREAEYTNHAGGFNGGGKFVLCRVADGSWKLAS